jgi:serine/threonine protein kinase
MQYDYSANPRRELTKRTENSLNDGLDNEEHDYILKIGDILSNPEGEQYKVLDMLGKGTFGQVVKCRRAGGETCALKVLKNKPAYYAQGLVEVKLLMTLNHKYDPNDEKHIVRCIDYFVFHNHLVIVFELLSLNLYELLERNNHRSLSVQLIRVFT